MAFRPEPPLAHDTPERTAVLLVNLGTPEAPTAPAVRRYLREFLSDPRVVEIPRPIWTLILNGIILPLRPKRSAAKYASIWMKEGSPLAVHTERQAQLLRGLLGERFRTPLLVRHAMRYGEPSVERVLAELKAENATRIVVVPMYPQYAASTTGSVVDAVAAFLRQSRNLPAVRLIRGFATHPGYIAALAAQVRRHWAQAGRPWKLVMSFHGVPRATLELGDPYHCECHATARALAAALGLAAEDWIITFQSRFGRARWLEPYTAATLAEVGAAARGRVDVITPGFVADCLETLEEIAMEGREVFLHAGGKDYRALPCLNEEAEWIAALADIASAELAGWTATSFDAAAERAELADRAARAKALGAAR